MTPEEMQTRSREKVNQVMELAKVLRLRQEIKRHLDVKTGFIEDIVIWVDYEEYPRTGESIGSNIQETEVEVVAPVVEPVETTDQESHAEEPA